MNSRIASLLKDRVSQFTYVDKLAGLVRAITYERAGQKITIPVDIGVNDPLACPDEAISDLVPNEGYGCIVYFEDRGMRRISTRTRGVEYESRMRLVCWVNTSKFQGDNTAGDRILQQFLGALQVGSHNTGPFIGVRHSVDGVPERGKNLFAPYTYPDSARQYLMWPFDAFGIDIVTTFRIKPGCEEQVQQGDESCWSPPTNRRRRNPSEFTCEELNAPITGLTDTQKGCIEGCGSNMPCTDPLQWELRDTQGNLLQSGNVPDPCGKELPVTAPGATVTFDGQPLITVPSGATDNITCNSLVNAAYVQDGGSRTGTYKVDGTVNGKDRYRLDGTHTLEYSGTRWEGVFPGPDVQAAIGNEDFPWQADWSGTGITVTQASIAQYCDQCDPPTLCEQIAEATAESIVDCIEAADKTEEVAALICDPCFEIEESIVEFISSGTYTPPADLVEIVVFAQAAGGGGGGGRSVSTGGSASGGGRGGSGAYVIRRIPAASVPNPTTVTIGAAGTGGNGGSNSNGVAGGNAADTSFGSLVIAKGGGGGRGGSTDASTPSNPAVASDCTPAFRPWASTGVTPGGSATTATINGADGSAGAAGIAPSGGNGGGRATTSTPFAGGNGGGNYNNSALTAGGAGATIAGAAGANGADNVKLDYMILHTSLTPTIGHGTAGGGGAYNGAGNGGAGGTGGKGTGGAGGGGSINTATGGRGADGGAGFIVVLERKLVQI